MFLSKIKYTSPNRPLPSFRFTLYLSLSNSPINGSSMSTIFLISSQFNTKIQWIKYYEETYYSYNSDVQFQSPNKKINRFKFKLFQCDINAYTHFLSSFSSKSFGLSCLFKFPLFSFYRQIKASKFRI